MGVSHVCVSAQVLSFLCSHAEHLVIAIAGMHPHLQFHCLEHSSLPTDVTYMVILSLVILLILYFCDQDANRVSICLSTNMFSPLAIHLSSVCQCDSLVRIGSLRTRGGFPCPLHNLVYREHSVNVCRATLDLTVVQELLLCSVKTGYPSLPVCLSCCRLPGRRVYAMTSGLVVI